MTTNKAKPARQAQSLPPLTCRHANRSDCALYEPNRPAKEWYEQKIKETDGLDSALPSGALAGNQSQPAPQGAAEVMHLVEKYASDTADFVLVGSPVSSCEPIEQAITAIIAERDALRTRVAELLDALIELHECGGEIPSWRTRGKVCAAIAASKEIPR